MFKSQFLRLRTDSRRRSVAYHRAFNRRVSNKSETPTLKYVRVIPVNGDERGFVVSGNPAEMFGHPENKGSFCVTDGDEITCIVKVDGEVGIGMDSMLAHILGLEGEA